MARLGLIGTGKQGQRYIRTLSYVKNIELVGVCNTAGVFGEFKAYKDWKDLLNQNLDGLIIAADPGINHNIIKHAAFLKVPVLVEKPVALYMADINDMERLKIPILVDYTHLFSPLYRQMKGNIKSPIKRIAIIGYNMGPFRYYSGLYDYAPHQLAMGFDLAPGNYNIVEQKCKKGQFGGRLYTLQLKSKTTELMILTGNGGAEKKQHLVLWCADGTEHHYNAANEHNKSQPLLNVVNHFVDIVNKRVAKPDFKLTVDIHNILYQLGKKYARS